MSGRVVAVVLAGGSGTRMAAARRASAAPAQGNKVHLTIAGQPLLAYCLQALDACAIVTDVVLVVRPGDTEATEAVLAVARPRTLRAVVPGGTTRQGSEVAGIAAARAIPAPHDAVVLLHDGARPFLTVDLVERLVVATRAHDGALPALPFDGPVLTVAGAVAGAVSGVRGGAAASVTARATGELRAVDTSALRRVQTPQAFRLDLLGAAYDAASASGFDGVDTADTVHHHHPGAAVIAVPGDPRNLKVTTPADLPVAEALAARWRAGRWLDGA